MSYQIALELEDVSGALIRVMSCLRKLGLKTISQNFEVLSEGRRSLTLEVEGPQLTNDELRPGLEAVNGVKKLLGEGNDETAAPPVVEKKAAPQETAERFKDKNSEAGDAEIRDKMLVFSLLSRYPNISARVAEIHNSIPETGRDQRMLELGESFGKNLSKNLKTGGSITDLKSAIEHLLFPALTPLLQIAQCSEGLQVSGYTKNMKHAANKPDCCQFVHGTIQGLLDSAEALPKHHVEKRDCSHDGSAACKYQLSAA